MGSQIIAPVAARQRRMLWVGIFSLFLLTLLVDQGSKRLMTQIMNFGDSTPLIEGYFSLTLYHNEGAAFGVLPKQQWLFIGFALLTVLAILYYLPRWVAERPLCAWAAALLVGGGVGNLIDRLQQGSVIDFFHLRFPGLFQTHGTLIFNVADLAICAGGILFFCELSRRIKES